MKFYNLSIKKSFGSFNAFINTAKINTELKSKEIENLIKNKFQNLKDEDIYKKELKEDLFELIRNISIKCSWVTCLSNFPYKDENSERDYNTLGYFRIEKRRRLYKSRDNTQRKIERYQFSF